MSVTNDCLRIVAEADGDGFHAYCPALKGLHVCGGTEHEALENAKDAAIAYLCSLIKHGDQYERWYTMELPRIKVYCQGCDKELSAVEWVSDSGRRLFMVKPCEDCLHVDTISDDMEHDEILSHIFTENVHFNLPLWEDDGCLTVA